MSEFLTEEERAKYWEKIREAQSRNLERQKQEEEERRKRFEEELLKEELDRRAILERKATYHGTAISNLSDEEKKELRQKQIVLGKYIDGQKMAFHEELDEKERAGKLVPEISKRGRPKKNTQEKVKGIVVKLSPYYRKFLMSIFGGGKGASTKLRYVLYQYEILKERERLQVQQVRLVIREIERLFTAYGSRWKRAEKTPELQILASQIDGEIKKLSTLLSVLNFRGDKWGEKERGVRPQKRYDFLEDHLTKEEKKTYEFAFYWAENMVGRDLGVSN